MNPSENIIEEFCRGCVYYPPNLPESAYQKSDYKLLQLKGCSYDHFPGDKHCRSTRKTSCSVVDLKK